MNYDKIKESVEFGIKNINLLTKIIKDCNNLTLKYKGSIQNNLKKILKIYKVVHN